MLLTSSLVGSPNAHPFSSISVTIEIIFGPGVKEALRFLSERILAGLFIEEEV